jgi:hypothetical protein
VVQPEEVGRVVLFLDRREPAEILPECAAHHGVVVLVEAGEVHVLPAGGVRLQPVEHLAAPGDGCGVVRLVFPVALDPDQERRGAVAERGVLLAGAGEGAAELPQIERGVR